MCKNEGLGHQFYSCFLLVEDHCNKWLKFIMLTIKRASELSYIFAFTLQTNQNVAVSDVSSSICLPVIKCFYVLIRVKLAGAVWFFTDFAL